MSEELKIILVSGLIGAVGGSLIMWIFNKTNFGKKESREEIEERNFGRKNKSHQ